MASGGELAELHRVAERLHASAARRMSAGLSRLPALFLLTDPARMPDPAAIADCLPPGCAVIFRAFGSDDAVERGLALARICRRRRLLLLVGADARLARRIGADGVHLPERLLRSGPALRRAWPDARLTGAAHGPAAMAIAAASHVEALLISPVFASSSPSAGSPIGVSAVRRLVCGSTLPLIALGGIDASNAAELAGSGVAGLASVSALQRAAGVKT